MISCVRAQRIGIEIGAAASGRGSQRSGFPKMWVLPMGFFGTLFLIYKIICLNTIPVYFVYRFYGVYYVYVYYV